LPLTFWRGGAQYCWRPLTLKSMHTDTVIVIDQSNGSESSLRSTYCTKVSYLLTDTIRPTRSIARPLCYLFNFPLPPPPPDGPPPSAALFSPIIRRVYEILFNLVEVGTVNTANFADSVGRPKAKKNQFQEALTRRSATGPGWGSAPDSHSRLALPRSPCPSPHLYYASDAPGVQ